MPYRRLPNTDNARFKALKSAYKKGKELPPFKLAFSQSTFQKVQSFLPSFERAMIQQKNAFSVQTEKNKEYQTTLKKAKLYISHFIQVVNMAILRGEISPSVRLYYGLEEDDKKLPSLNTEADIIEWGKNTIEGEYARTAKGFSPITNPTIAVVKVRYENFMDAYKFQKTLKNNNARALSQLAEHRAKADSIILNVWNEVEESFSDLPEQVKREKANEYGLVYVFRKNEIGNINFFENHPGLI